MDARGRLGELAVRRDLHLLSLIYTRSRDALYIDPTVRRMRMDTGVLLPVPRAAINSLVSMVSLVSLVRAPVTKGNTMWNAFPL